MKKCQVRDISIHYIEIGEGKPILFIHGWSPDHRMMRGCFEPIFSEKKGYRRIYLDLPGMGQTPVKSWIQNSDDILEILCEFIHHVIRNEKFLLAGCSYGGYLSLGLLHKIGHRIDGAFLLVPMAIAWDHGMSRIHKHTIWEAEQLSLEEENDSLNTYREMAVIASTERFHRWQQEIQSGLDCANRAFIENKTILNYSTTIEEAIQNLVFDKPTSIIAGRQDNSRVCDYMRAYEIATRFSRATLAVLDGGGHILHLDNESLFTQLVLDWVWRVELDK